MPGTSTNIFFFTPPTFKGKFINSLLSLVCKISTLDSAFSCADFQNSHNRSGDILSSAAAGTCSVVADVIVTRAHWPPSIWVTLSCPGYHYSSNVLLTHNLDFAHNLNFPISKVVE